MRTPNPITRRTFIHTAAAAASAAYLLPARSWARAAGANQRVTFGVIGCGGMGTSHLHSLMERRKEDNIAVLKVCDVYRRRLNNAIKSINGDSNSGTMEYRELLDDKNIDVILIATPDHWHTKIAIEAMDAGKDVYCEKPLALTVEQAIECRNAVRRTGRVLQVGPQRTSEDKFWKAREAIAANRIGKVIWSQGSYCRNSREGQFNWPIDADAGPSNPKDADGFVWWDRWLGYEWNLAEKIDWSADRFFRFRKYWAYNGGVATDLLYHLLAPLLLSISGPNGEYPRKVVAAGGKYIEKDERDIPDSFMLMIDYPSEHTVCLASVMTNDGQWDTIIRGQYGTIELTGDEPVFKEQSTWMKEFRQINAGLVENRVAKNDKGEDKPDPAPGKASFTMHTSPRRDHMGNFIDSVRGTDKPNCNVELGCATMAAIKMGVEAYRKEKVMLWDSQKELIVES